LDGSLKQYWGRKKEVGQKANGGELTKPIRGEVLVRNWDGATSQHKGMSQNLLEKKLPEEITEGSKEGIEQKHVVKKGSIIPPKTEN